MKLGDWVVVAAAIAVSVAFTSAAADRAQQGGFVEITAADETLLYPLSEDRQVTVDGPLGETHIEIRNGRAYVHDSPCRDKICITTGWLESAGDWSACLPNRVFVSIRGGETAEGAPDAVAR